MNVFINCSNNNNSRSNNKNNNSKISNKANKFIQKNINKIMMEHQKHLLTKENFSTLSFRWCLDLELISDEWCSRSRASWTSSCGRRRW